MMMIISKILNNFTIFFLGRIGIEFDHANLILKNKLNDALPTTTEFQDVGEMTMKMRMVKSPEELGKFTKVSFSLKHLKISFINLLHVIPFQKYFKTIFTKKDLYYFIQFYMLLYSFSDFSNIKESFKIPQKK